MGSCEHSKSGPDLVQEVLSDLKITKEISGENKHSYIVRSAAEVEINAKKFLSGVVLKASFVLVRGAAPAKAHYSSPSSGQQAIYIRRECNNITRPHSYVKLHNIKILLSAH